jgi:hypothetical protein
MYEPLEKLLDFYCSLVWKRYQEELLQHENIEREKYENDPPSTSLRYHHPINI